MFTGETNQLTEWWERCNLGYNCRLYYFFYITAIVEKYSQVDKHVIEMCIRIFKIIKLNINVC